MPQEWTIKKIWVVVGASNRIYYKAFKRKHLAEDWIAKQPWPDHYRIIAEDATFI